MLEQAEEACIVAWGPYEEKQTYRIDMINGCQRQRIRALLEVNMVLRQSDKENQD